MLINQWNVWKSEISNRISGNVGFLLIGLSNFFGTVFVDSSFVVCPNTFLDSSFSKFSRILVSRSLLQTSTVVIVFNNASTLFSPIDVQTRKVDKFPAKNSAEIDVKNFCQLHENRFNKCLTEWNVGEKRRRKKKRRETDGTRHFSTWVTRL